MSGAVTVSDPFVDGLIGFTEEWGARSPGWFKAECDRCGDYMTGSEDSVEDWAYEHANEHRQPPWMIRKLVTWWIYQWRAGEGYVPRDSFDTGAEAFAAFAIGFGS